MKDNSTPVPAETEEGDVIEAVHDHRRKEDSGKHTFISEMCLWFRLIPFSSNY